MGTLCPLGGFPFCTPIRLRFFFHFLVVLREVHGAVTIGHGLQEQALCPAVGHQVLLRISLQVSEVRSRCPVHVDGLDVMKGVELFGSQSALAVQAYLERAHIS